MRQHALPLFAAAATALASAAGSCANTPLSTMSWSAAVPLGLDPVIPIPPDNPPTPAKLALGQALFFDPILSLDGSLSCASCHRPELGFGDDSAVSHGLGGEATRRNVPPLMNRAWGRSFFRDGRAATLEAAVLQPIFNPRELGLTSAMLEARLAAEGGYRRLARDAFGESPPTTAMVADALATFIRSLQVGGSPADRFAAGEVDALSAEARTGRALFLGKAGCARCHTGPDFTDEAFHNTGIAVLSEDPGRYVVTGMPRHEGAFRTPTLRNLTHTAPYMHDGSLATLQEVVEFYDEGGIPNPNLDFEIRPLRLTEDEKAAILAFLEELGVE